MPTIISLLILLVQIIITLGSMIVVVGVCFCAMFEVEISARQRPKLVNALWFSIGVILTTGLEQLLQ